MTSRVIIFGGSGELGSSLVSLFKKQNWVVTSVGTRQNSEATQNIIVPIDDSLEIQGEKVLNQSTEQLKADNAEKYDAILCVAGGFVMGNLVDKEFLKKSELMIKKSLYSSLVASQLAAHQLKEGGFLMLTGVAGLKGTPGFIGYGVGKAGVHQLVKSLSGKGSGLPKNAKVVGLCPSTIDTSPNRKAMPNADFSNFIPLETLTQRVFDWTTGAVPIENGNLVEVITKNGQTTFSDCHSSF
ncbi:30449_t:CDS:2 [Gigaspora margarita]|uniref:30449_t:CDS:1 n=1 Tax=Gigaspora margarita TaxID=4874 RepID=A0ABM8W7A1_GIGMA|nr:30449_t:CDS:2 [Gigaspora margarita]